MVGLCEMDIESISGAATVALASTLVFVLVAKSWQLINRSIGTGVSFSGSIMREAAQRFREEFDRLSSNQSTYLSAGVVYVVLFVAAYALQARQLFLGYPVWQLYVLLGTLLVGALLALYRLGHDALNRHRSDRLLCKWQHIGVFLADESLLDCRATCHSKKNDYSERDCKHTHYFFNHLKSIR